MKEQFHNTEAKNDAGSGITFTMNKVSSIVDNNNGTYTVTLQSGTSKNLESSFNKKTNNVTTGVMGYCSCEGLLNKGKRKNAYTETYADSNRLRVHQDANVTREATEITFKFAFAGVDRRKVYEDFVSYLKNGTIEYHDTARGRYAYLILIDAVEPSDDFWKGSDRYILCDFKFKNIFGNTFSTKNSSNIISE